jgi:glycosyltransferase involved in cell wall biosynthesis
MGFYKMKPAIAVVSMGNPRDPRVWSGTPNAIVFALEGLGVSVTTVSLQPPRIARDALKALSLLTGNGAEYSRTRISSLLSDLSLPRRLGPEVSVCLHMGTATVPTSGRGPVASRQAIYLDSTFHLMSEQAKVTYGKTAKRRYESFENRALSTVEHVFTVSKYVKADVVGHYGVPAERVTVVGTGRGNVRPMEGAKNPSDYVTLFVAKDRFEEKGGPLLLNGFRLAVRSDKRLKLIVVAQEQYRSLVESVPGASFKTALPWPELEALFNRALLFAMPAKYEPWGLVYIEALACGTPVLGLNRNALPELTLDGKAGFLLNEDTPEAIAIGLLDAFSNTDRLAEMGRIGSQHVLNHYNWEKTALKIYETLFCFQVRQRSAIIYQ